MDNSVSAHVQAIPSKSDSDNGPEIQCRPAWMGALLTALLRMSSGWGQIACG